MRPVYPSIKRPSNDSSKAGDVQLALEWQEQVHHFWQEFPYVWVVRNS